MYVYIHTYIYLYLNLGLVPSNYGQIIKAMLQKNGSPLTELEKSTETCNKKVCQMKRMKRQ